MKQRITAISFDVDGTLVTPAFADLIWLEVLPQLVSDCWKISTEDAKNKLFADYESLGPERPEWYDLPYWLKRYHLEVNPKTLVQQYRSAVMPYPEVIDVLEKLRDRYELLVVSNSKRLFLDVTTDGLKPYFKHIFSTLSDFGLMKDVEAYNAVAEKVGIDLRQTAHVGDNFVLDYVKAKKAGLRAFYLDRNGRRRGRYFVKDLKEFAMKLG
jgi:putative hydrolase of the HAD superfamily